MHLKAPGKFWQITPGLPLQLLSVALLHSLMSTNTENKVWMSFNRDKVVGRIRTPCHSKVSLQLECIQITGSDKLVYNNDGKSTSYLNRPGHSQKSLVCMNIQMSPLYSCTEHLSHNRCFRLCTRLDLTQEFKENKSWLDLWKIVFRHLVHRRFDHLQAVHLVQAPSLSDKEPLGCTFSRRTETNVELAKFDIYSEVYFQTQLSSRCKPKVFLSFLIGCTVTGFSAPVLSINRC